MFAWDLYKSAEAMFSRWAIKRLLRFLLKKKLGDYILGDIDLDQLDVQLRQGIVQLTDLALNVDFLNGMLDSSQVVVKEGSVASLLVRVPLNMKDWQIEVEELELVLAPNGSSRGSTSDDMVHMKIDHNATVSSPIEHGQSMDEGSSHSSSMNVHEGVKIVAKIVKLFLTSFRFRLKNLIIAFDPGSEAAGKHPELSRILVFRIADMEFGTCISEDMTPCSGVSILGISKLTNFIKFQGAVLEFLEINQIDNKEETSSLLDRSFSEFYSENSSPLGFTMKILGGPTGGFSGVLDLSIPWKNGCLDIQKLSAEFSIDPVHARLFPGTIMWIVSLRGYLRDHLNDSARSTHLPKGSGLNIFHGNPDATTTHLPKNSSLLSQEIITSGTGNCNSSHFPLCNESMPNDLHPSSMPDGLDPSPHVIHNWIPSPVDYTVKFEPEYDYEASVDQFFECFDAMRSSQASSGNSGVWNLACSVFSAITAASNLASDSEQMYSEQQNVQGNLKAMVAAVSVDLLFNNETNWSSQVTGNGLQANDTWGSQYKSFTSVGLADYSSSGEGFQSCMSSTDFVDSAQLIEENLRSEMHMLNILCINLTFNFQKSPECTRFGATVQRIKVDDHFLEQNMVGNNCFPCINNSPMQTDVVQHFQVGVEDALPPFCSVPKDKKAPDVHMADLYHTGLSTEDHMHADIFKAVPFNESYKVTLFESFGECSGEYFARRTSLGAKAVSSASFSLKLPPFIFWVDIQLVNLLMNFFRQLESSVQTSNSMKASDCGTRLKETNLSADRDVKNAEQNELVSSQDLHGNILLSNARIILCLDLDNKHYCRIYHWDTFISLDISGVNVDKVGTASRIPIWGSNKSYTYSDFASVRLYSGTVNVYLVTAASTGIIGTNFHNNGSCYSASKIVSAAHQLNNSHSTVSLLWKKTPVTDLKMSRVHSLVASKDPRIRNKVTGTNEFIFVRTAEEVDSQLHQELIQSSSFIIHIWFSLVSVDLRHHEYVKLHDIICRILDSLSRGSESDDIVGKNLQSSNTMAIGRNSQASFFIEVNNVDVGITYDVVEETSKLLQRELPGSWVSFRLIIQKFELLCVSNVGGSEDASFFGISHGEGDLWGSISTMDGKPSSASAGHGFLLISCRDSVLRRGDGLGGNATSSGLAGTSVVHFKNPQASYFFTSIVVRCGTIVAPGCRFDWFDSIFAFFKLPCCQEKGADPSEDMTSNDVFQYKSSFCLDLVDAALSYEPHIIGTGASQCSHGLSDTNVSNQKYVACILAASSFSLCQIAEDPLNDNYNLRLHDLGLLICKWPGSNCDKRYDVDYLGKLGYIKIASNAAMAATVRTKCGMDLLWEIEFSSLDVKMNTCGDTTMGLVCLVCQLQQIFAPDIDEALVHLQSRWSSNQLVQEAGKLSTGDFSELVNHDEAQIGLMDQVVDGIFFHQSEEAVQSNSGVLQKEFLGGKDSVGELTDVNLSCSSKDIPCRSSSVGSHQDMLKTLQPDYAGRICMPEIVESYYVAELLPGVNHSPASYYSNEVPNFQDNTSHMESVEKSGWYQNKSLVIVENHIGTDHYLAKEAISEGDNSIPHFPLGTCKPRGRIILKDSEIRWRMFGGNDWPQAEISSSQNSKSSGRDKNACLVLHLQGLNLQHDMYPDGELIVSNLSLTLQDFFLCDYSSNAPWKTVLGYYHSKLHPRESCARALKLDLESVRPNPSIPLEEYRLQIAILPIRLHLDQSQLDFLASFFAGSALSESTSGANNLNQQRNPKEECCGNVYLPNEALLPFFQKCDIWPVVVRVDYIPRHINVAALRGGNYIELINLVSWKGIDLQLKHVHAVGIYGWGGICEAVAGEWLEDISKNQVHKLLKGLKPISSLLSVGSSTARLVSLPVKDYRKDRRLVKGMQRGALSFIRSISIEAVGLGVHLAGGVHDILLKTECALAGSPRPLASSSKEKASSIRSDQPKDVRQGMQQAYESLSDGIGRTASALVGNPLKTYQRGGGTGLAVASAIRAAPSAAVAPASSAARAVHCALLGVRNSLDPEHKKDSMEKYNGSSDY